ncbi:MAG: radical SAM protein [Candidatus Cloacimonetes bacterium]|nr:radical SAM protein [Candidatus Cloacimonadota bacterium]
MNILAVFLPHRGCPFQCIYCDQHAIGEPAPSPDELTVRLDAFCTTSSSRPRQVAFYGGTFTALPRDEQSRWLDLIAPWLPQLDGIRLSTRPDCIEPVHLDWLKRRGVRTIELGVQSFADAELSATSRGYTATVAQQACREALRNGFELGVQLMPGLPESSASGWRHTIDATLRLRPSFVRLYPLVTLRGTALETMWRQGRYTPLTLDEATRQCVQAVQAFEAEGIAVAKIGLHGDLAPDAVLAGPWHPAFGEHVRRQLLLLRLPGSLGSGDSLTFSSRDVSLLRGEGGWLLREIYERAGVKIPIMFDSEIKSGTMLSVKSTPS